MTSQRLRQCAPASNKFHPQARTAPSNIEPAQGAIDCAASAPAIANQFASIGEDHFFEAHAIGSVGNAVADRSDLVTGLQSILVPAGVGHSTGAGAASAPLLNVAPVIFRFEIDPYVRVAP